MNENTDLRVLVVDDEQAIRELTVRALGAEGFLCDTAVSGQQALDMVDDGEYDVVITDLRMPRGHGYALITDLLKRKNRPVIVVLTGIIEPRLTKDLLARGVDYIEFKPAKYDLFAAKVRGVANRKGSKADSSGSTSGAARPGGSPPRQPRPSKRAGGGHPPSPGGSSEKVPDDPVADATPRPEQARTKAVSKRSISRRLVEFARRRALPEAAKKVLELANADDFQPRKVTETIEKDKRLKKDVVRMANTRRFRGNEAKINDLQQAILQIGRKRIGEYAIASSARHEISVDIGSWLNLDLAWRRSLAAGAAIDWLLDGRAASPADRGLSISARMQPFGRIVMGMTYPDRYQQLIKEARATNQPLRAHESRIFSRSPNEVIAQLMERWGISASMALPLRFATEDYMSLMKLDEPLGTRAELVKFAVWIGRLAVGRWEPWDLIEIPPGITMRRLNVEQPAQMIAEVRAQMDDAVRQGIYPECIERPEQPDELPPVEHEFAYHCLSPEPYDYLPNLIRAMGVALRRSEPSGFASAGPGLVNCIWTLPESLSDFLCKHNVRNVRLIVTDKENVGAFHRFGRTIAMPTSFGALRAMCHRIAAVEKNREPAGIG